MPFSWSAISHVILGHADGEDVVGDTIQLRGADATGGSSAEGVTGMRVNR